jgi:hypothetical protein
MRGIDSVGEDGFGDGMKTVRPLGLVVLGCLVAFALSGCGSVLGLNRTASVEFTQNGVPLELSSDEYQALRHEVRSLLAKRELNLVDSPSKSQMIARVELKTSGTAPKRTATEMQVTRVLVNFAAPGAWDLVSMPNFSDSAQAAPTAAPSFSVGSHPSLGLARSLDTERSAGDSPMAGR